VFKFSQNRFQSATSPISTRKPALGERSISTTQGKSSRLPNNVRIKDEALQKPLGTRSVSFSSQQGQTVKNEPPEYRSPAGLASTPVPETEGRPLLMPNNLFHPILKFTIARYKTKSRIHQAECLLPPPKSSSNSITDKSRRPRSTKVCTRKAASCACQI
jgi:splicing suppressor protein 51